MKSITLNPGANFLPEHKTSFKTSISSYEQDIKNSGSEQFSPFSINNLAYSSLFYEELTSSRDVFEAELELQVEKCLSLEKKNILDIAFIENVLGDSNWVRLYVLAFFALSKYEIDILNIPRLDDLILNLNSMEDETVCYLTGNGQALLPLLNLTEIFFRSKNLDLNFLGLKYLNIALVIDGKVRGMNQKFSVKYFFF